MLTSSLRRDDVLELRRFSIPVRAENLIDVLRDPSQEPIQSYGLHVDFTGVSSLASTQIASRAGCLSGWDGELGLFCIKH